MHNAKEMRRPLTLNEQLQNLLEGLCEEPFQLDSAEDIRFDSQHLAETKEGLIVFAERFAKEHNLAQGELNFKSSTEVSESFRQSSTDKDKESPDGPPTSRKL